MLYEDRGLGGERYLVNVLRMNRIASMPYATRRILAVAWLARLVRDHRRGCLVLSAWYDTPHRLNRELVDAAEIVAMGAIRRQMRMIDFLSRRYAVQLWEIRSA